MRCHYKTTITEKAAKPACDWSAAPVMAGVLLLFAFVFFCLRLQSFALCFEALFLALRPLRGAFHKFGAYQLQHGQLRPIALAVPKARDPRVAAGALPEASAEGIEQLLDRLRRGQERSGLTARVQRVALGESDHLFDERLDCLRLGNSRDDALRLNHTRGQILEKTVARSN